MLPDYQGIGIGRRFLGFVADIYKNKGFDFRITTSAVNFCKSLLRDDGWILTRAGICKEDAGTIKYLKEKRRVKTYTFKRK